MSDLAGSPAVDPTNRMELVEGKVSLGMKQTLEGLMRLLVCPLCQDMFQRPTTLASCGHSFCEACIDDYNATSSTCPVEGCRMPMSIVGGRRGSYRNINPQLAQSVESLKLICKGLNNAPDQWWKNHSLEMIQTEEDEDSQATDLDADPMGSQSDSDDENLIDLPIS